MWSLEPLRVKLEERLREMMSLPLERMNLVVDAERSFRELSGHFILYWRRDVEWHLYKFEITKDLCDEAAPFPDEPPPEFLEAHMRWKERDGERAKYREYLASSIAYRVSP